MGQLLNDLKYGARMWKKTPIITLVTVFSLALAIAANTTMFALAGGLLFAPFPYEDQKNLLLLERAEIDELTSESRDQICVPDFLELQSQMTSFSGLCLFMW